MSGIDLKRAYIAWVAICIIWGTTYLAIRVGVQDLPPVLFAGLRWIIAGPILLIILKLRGFQLPGKKDFLHLAVIGLLLIGGGNGLVVFSEQWLPSGLTALLVTTVPFWVVGIEAVIPSGPKLNKIIVIGLTCGLAGVFLIFGDNFSGLFNSSYIYGVVGLMISEFTWSLGTIYSKYKKVSVHPLMSAAVQMTVAGFVLSLIGVSIGELSVLHFHLNSTLAFLYLLVMGSLVAYGSYIYAVAHLPVSFVSTYAYINPVIALFLGWLILGETINVPIIIGAVVILGGVGLVKKGSSMNKLNMGEVD